MDLSICIIAKNEEKNIARCLQCLVPTGFEIVVVDTGSLDRTKEIAREYTDKVYDFIWCNDFAAARNYAISKASGEYILCLDCDEFLGPLDVEGLLQIVKQHPGQVGRIRLKNVFSQSGERRENLEWLNRIFPKKEFCYTGKIHEQITAKNGALYETYETSVSVVHTGYDLTSEEREKKTRRNIVLLQQELERLLQECCMSSEEDFARQSLLDADNNIPYVLYQLGKSYYMAGDYTTACEYFSKGLSYDLNPKLEYVIDMVETYGYALINSGQVEMALFFENIYEEFAGSADFQFLMGLIYMKNARFENAVQEFQKATEHAQCRVVGANSYMAYYNIGVIYECLGRTDEARKYYEKCGEYEPAAKRLANLK